MNKTIYTLLAMLVASLSLQAVADDYLPLVREGVRWHYGYIDDFDDSNLEHWQCYYEFKGDSIINGNVYKKLYCTITNGAIGNPYYVMEETTKLECCMMEKDKVVYAIYNPDTQRLDWEYYPCDSWVFETEYGMKLYDFNQPSDAKKAQYEIQGKKCNHFYIDFDYWGHYNEMKLKMNLIEGFGYTIMNDYVYCTLPHPYMPICTCARFWYFVKFTDTEDNILFDPRNPVPVGVNDVKVETAKADGRYYNLQGQAVDIKTAPAGIYIHNGKKFVVQ